jgi:sigma-54 dependent transcriptional regulator, acetoin dehydrogenase operon transcriptional activator AcoR
VLPTSDSDVSLLYVLVEGPGIVRAAGPDSRPVTIGSRVEQSFGIDWPTMVDLAESRTPLRSAHGELSFSVLRDESDAIRNILIHVNPSTASRSSRPPSITTRPVLMEWVLGRDPGMTEAVGLAQKLASMSLPVYLSGERGTGLETLALHLAATRSHEGPILRFDATEELFGRPDAKGGVLVVGHLDELDSSVAKRLAKELSQGLYAGWQLIGWGYGCLRDKSKPGGVRELGELVGSSTVELPPLRRRSDLEHLVRAMLKTMTREDGSEFDVAPEAMRRLVSYSWPGNLQELRAVLARTTATTSSERIFELILPSDGGGIGATEGLRRVAERRALEEAMRSARGNVSVAARQLGVARSTLYRLLERHSLARS